jgi:hypothetical protein
MALMGSASASRISSEFTTTVFGTPATRSRPFTSMVSGCRAGYALPIWHLDALGGLLADGRLYLRFMYAMIASSILSPPTRTLCE